MQVQHQQPPSVCPIALQLLETLGEPFGITRDGHTPFSQGVEVIAFQHDRERKQLALGRLHAVGVLIVGPVTYVLAS
jgi:hypothetical protein